MRLLAVVKDLLHSFKDKAPAYHGRGFSIVCFISVALILCALIALFIRSLLSVSSVFCSASVSRCSRVCTSSSSIARAGFSCSPCPYMAIRSSLIWRKSKPLPVARERASTAFKNNLCMFSPACTPFNISLCNCELLLVLS